MQGLIAILFIITQVCPVAAEPNNGSTLEYIGQMPEIVVTAPRYEHEDVAWCGMMEEVDVTAPRYECEDVAWCGMMPETIVTAPRYTADEIAVMELLDKFTVFAERFAQGVHDLQIETIGFAYAEPVIEFEIDPCVETFSEDYYVPAEDTVDEDVTVHGGNAKIDGVIDGDLVVMGGTVDVNGIIDGEVAIFGGNLNITGTITDDAAVFGGHVNNKGTIKGDLALIGGTVLLDSGSVIEGDINMVGGTVDRDTNAVVLGEIESVEIEALERILPRIGKISRIFKWREALPGRGLVAGFVGTAVLLVIYIINLLVLLIFPGSIDRVVEKLHQNIWASVGFGFGLQILYVPLITLFAVSIVGIPLIPIFVLAVCLAIMFGFSAISLTMGERIIKSLSWQIKGRVGTFTIGWIALMLILIIGFILRIPGMLFTPAFAFGGIIIYVAATIGLGGVIYALVKREKKEDKK